MPPPFRIQYVGNLFVDMLHDHYSKLAHPGVAPYLALLGNIGNPYSPTTSNFLDYCSHYWKRVFWIPGPVEYGATFPGSRLARPEFRDSLDQMRYLVSKRKNISILDQTIVSVENVKLVGTTLWTPCDPRRIHEKYSQLEFNSIRKGGKFLTPLDIAEWNEEDVQFLRTEIPRCEDPTIVLTHHLPHPALLSATNPLSTLKRIGLEVNMLEHLLEPPCKYWLCGASGSSSAIYFPKGTMATTNSLYEFPFRSREVKNNGFDPCAYVEIGKRERFPYEATYYLRPRTQVQKQQLM